MDAREFEIGFLLVSTLLGIVGFLVAWILNQMSGQLKDLNKTVGKLSENIVGVKAEVDGHEGRIRSLEKQSNQKPQRRG